MIPKEVQEFMKNKMAWVATASPDGVQIPHRRGLSRLLTTSTSSWPICFLLRLATTTEEPKVAVTVVDQEKHKGYQLKGSAQLVDSGPVFDRVAEQLKKAPMQLPNPKYVVIITVDSIFDQSVGPKAGQQMV